MKIIDSRKNEIEIANSQWPVAEPLFYKWGAIPNQKNEIFVVDVNEISPELSAWGIPWKRNS